MADQLTVDLSGLNKLKDMDLSGTKKPEETKPAPKTYIDTSSSIDSIKNLPQDLGRLKPVVTEPATPVKQPATLDRQQLVNQANAADRQAQAVAAKDKANAAAAAQSKAAANRVQLGNNTTVPSQDFAAMMPKSEVKPTLQSTQAAQSPVQRQSRSVTPSQLSQPQNTQNAAIQKAQQDNAAALEQLKQSQAAAKEIQAQRVETAKTEADEAQAAVDKTVLEKPAVAAMIDKAPKTKQSQVRKNYNAVKTTSDELVETPKRSVSRDHKRKRR